MGKVELLAPAGDLEKLKMAVLYGADAVFIGGRQFSLRSRASNFTIEEIEAGCRFAHEHKAKVHVTCNIVMHEQDTNGILAYLKALEKAGVDCIIASSPAIIRLVATKTNMEAHVSTQTSVLNAEAVAFYKQLGASRVVLARELSIQELASIRLQTALDLEVFIHGGLCASYSGRCMLSNNMTNRDANRGGCAHSCRWNYDLFSEQKKVNPDGDFFSMSSKDLCAIRQLPQLMALGINSFKIEGRMKSLHYIATVVACYRHLIDEINQTGTVRDFTVYEKEIAKAENRPTSSGLLLSNATVDTQLYDLSQEMPSKDFIGIVLGYDPSSKMVEVEQRNFFLPDQTLEVFGPNRTFLLSIKEIYDADGNCLDAARHPRQKVYFKSDIELKPYELLRLDHTANL